MQTMNFEKDELVIEAEEVIKNFNNEELIRQDEEFANTKRTNFAFGGQSVRDRIKKRKMNSKIGNEVSRLEKIIMAKKGDRADIGDAGGDENDEESGEDINNKR